MTTTARALSIISIALAAIVAWNFPRLPEPAALDAPTAAFSAARAREAIHRVLGPGTPHPTGSPENAAVRERLLAELRGLGLEPEVQAGWGCWGSCAEVHNVVVRIPGQRPGALLMLTHYDSVPAGPGGADDGFGTAVMLETLRALRSEPAEVPADSLVFLFSDGEELGLVGAGHFAEAHPEADHIRAVFNVEARGTGGPAYLFQTGPQSGHLVEAFAELCPAPHGSSVMAAIFERMPNDTDYSVFKARGIPGLNLALNGEVSHYHTRNDQFDRIDPGSVQQVGTCALGFARRYAEGGLREPAPPRVFGLVAGIGVIQWGEPIAKWVAIVAFALSLWVGRRLASGFGALAVGGVSLVLSCVAAMAAGFLAQLAIATLAGGPAPWTANPWPAVVALFAAGTLGAWGVVAVARRTFAKRHTNPWLPMLGAWLAVQGLLGVAATFFVPGADWSFVVAVVGLCTVALLPRPFAAALLAGGSTLLFTPTLRATLDLGISGVSLGLSVALWLPALAQAFVSESRAPLPWGAALRPASIGAAVLGVGIAVAAWVAPFSEERPQSLVFLHHEDEEAGARWFARSSNGSIPETVAAAASLDQPMQPALPFTFVVAASRAGPEGPVTSPLPVAEVEASGPDEGALRRRVLRLRSERGADWITLALPPDAEVESVRVQGAALAPPSEKRLGYTQGWRLVRVATLPPEGALVELLLGGSEPIDAWLFDLSSALPDSAAPLLEARPRWAAPQHYGDASMVSRRIRIE